MKKIITLVLAITLVFVSGIYAFAVPAGFTESPTNETPSLDSFENEDPNCTAEIVVTTYPNIEDLIEAKQQELRDAYNEIVNNHPVFAKILAKLAELLNIDVNRLAVSEVFDVSYYESGSHDNHGAFTITIKAKNLDKFAGLLHRHNGNWVIVENAKVNGDTLTFTVDDLSPFAIVVDTGATTVPDADIPNTDVALNNQMPLQALLCAGAVASFAAIVAIVVKQKKVKE